MIKNKRKNIKEPSVKKKKAVKLLKSPVKKAKIKPVKKNPVTISVKKTIKKAKIADVFPEKSLKETKTVKKTLHPSHIYDKYDDNLHDFYGDTRIVLLPRDPYCIFAYWEVSLSLIDEAKNALGNEFNSSKSILRIYDVSNVIFNGNNANKTFDITLENLIRSRYIDISVPERTWVVDIGILTLSGKFFMLARSNAATTPADSMSNADHEEWMDSSEPGQTYLMRTGGGSLVRRRAGVGGIGSIYGTEGRSSGVSSAGVSSLSGPVKYEKNPSAFWMRVGSELIVYGAAEPGAKVTINNNSVCLNIDGSFSTRFALSDGLHKLEITGRSAAGKYKKTFKIKINHKMDKEE